MIFGGGRVDVREMESIGPITSLLILGTVINHNPDPLWCGLTSVWRSVGALKSQIRWGLTTKRRVLQISNVLR